jgi:hypothetical protein
MTEQASDFEWVIPPKRSLPDLNRRELREYREHLYFLT